VTAIGQIRVMSDPQRALAFLRKDPPFTEARTPDVIVLAVNPPGNSGRVTLEQIHQLSLHPPVIILAEPENGPASLYLNAGASDYVVNDHLAKLGQAVETAARSHALLRRLTPRQIEILRLVAQGLGTRAIAARLEISHKTVETHRADLMQRLGAKTVPELVHFAIRTKVVEIDGPQ